MEISVWLRFAKAASSVLTPFVSSLVPPQQAKTTSSTDAPGTAADSTSTSKAMTASVPSLIQIKRNTGKATSDLYFKGEWACFTLENQALLTPAGTYGLEIYDSPHAGHLVPRLQNVPGRTEVEIHCGNVEADSKGCILLGLGSTGDTIERSRDAFNILFPKIQTALQEGPQTIEIIDPLLKP
jgi:hypothetical protein